jgi:hypothetical protein
LVGALRGEDTEVKEAVKDAAELSGQLVSALVTGDVVGLRDVVGSVGDRAQKLEALADELGCGESVGALAGSVATVSNIITADHAKSAAVVGQAASDVGVALFGVLSAVGTAIVGGGDDSDDADGGGGKSAFASVISASGDAARTIGESIGTVADLTDELGGENNVVSNTIRELSEVNVAVGEVLSVTGKAVAKVASGEATAADVVALGADCRRRHSRCGRRRRKRRQWDEHGRGNNEAQCQPVQGGIRGRRTFREIGRSPRRCRRRRVGVVGVAADTVGVAAGSVSNVLQATHEAVEAAGDVVSAAGKAAVRVTEEGNGEASVGDVLSGLVSGARESDANIGEAVSGVTDATGSALGTRWTSRQTSPMPSELTAVGKAVGGLFGFGSQSNEEVSDEKHEENEEEVIKKIEDKLSQDDVELQSVDQGLISVGNVPTGVAAWTIWRIWRTCCIRVDCLLSVRNEAVYRNLLWKPGSFF